LECALEADARYLVSGDSDLLDLDEFCGVDIVNASEFLEYRMKFN
jgi:predicted nucleic acid-binding protein